MIAKQSIGKSFSGALNYNLKKMHHPDPKERAELLATNFISMEPVLIKKELAVMKAMNPKLNRNTYHTSLNFVKGEKISNDNMKAIAEEFMNNMGFDNNLYFIFRHHDTDHPHCHILALRNRFDGSVVSDSYNYKKGEKIIQLLEKKYHLIKAPRSINALNKAPSKGELKMMEKTGKVSYKLLMQEKVRDAINHSKTIVEFIDRLEFNGINVLFNQASTGRVFGITYLIPGFKIRGQALGNQFKWGSITKKVNYEQSRDGKKISQANIRTREKFGDQTNARISDNYSGLKSLNHAGAVDGRKPGKNNHFSKSAPSDKGQYRNTNLHPDQIFRNYDKGSKRDAMDLDHSVSRDRNPADSNHPNINDLIGLLNIDSGDEEDSKKNKKRRKMKR